MAGYEARLVSPFKPLPLALYAQLIGEDATHRVPQLFLAMYGVEGWTQFESGSSLRMQVEYADTRCTQTTPDQACAYINGLFSGGYQFLDRVIGYTTDSDSQTLAVSLRLVQQNGQTWSIKTRDGQLNRFDVARFSSTSPRSSRYDSAELSWRGDVLGLDWEEEAYPDVP